MLEPDAPPKPSESATALFAEYVARLDAGAPPEDLDALIARAGPHAEELRRRIRAYTVLERLGATLREGEDSPEPTGVLPSHPVLQEAQRVGRYEIRRSLGEGGLSRVHVALDTVFRREVALKVIASELVSPDSAGRWIEQEGLSLVRLEHPNVVRVLDLNVTEGQAFVAMELVDGPSLAQVLDELRARRDGGVESTDARVRDAADRLAGIGARARVAASIAQALAACHAVHVLHRDVKPGNVLLEGGATPKLIDFGLAHLGESGRGQSLVTQRLIGTPAYISPEQVESGRTGTDPRSDQFSFGVLLYELLTLRAPFQRDTRTQTMTAVARALPQAPRAHDAAIPVDLETICLHALERFPADRYPSMSALAADLEAFLDHRAIAIAPPGVGRRLKLWTRRHRRDVLLVGIPAVVLATGSLALAAVRARNARAVLDDDLARGRASVARLGSPLQLQTAYQTANELETRALDLDKQFIASTMYSSRRADARAYLHELSEQLRSRIAEGRLECAQLAHDVRASSENELLREFEAVLTLDAAFCPECPGNVVDRERGIVDLPAPPPGTQIEVHRIRPHPDPRLIELQPVETWQTLSTGEFRVLWTDDSARVLAEVDLSIQRRTQRATLALAPIPEFVRSRMVRVPAGEVEIFGARKAVAVPEFWAYSGWFTLADVQQRVESRALSVDDSLTHVYGLPKSQLVPGHAAYFARSVSARLPECAEAMRLLALTRSGALALEPFPEGVQYEFCSASPTPLGRNHLRHSRDATKPEMFLPVVDGGTPSGGAAFRVVISRSPVP